MSRELSATSDRSVNALDTISTLLLQSANVKQKPMDKPWAFVNKEN